jgi:hypothetical protein
MAATANTARPIEAPPCPIVRCGQERAGERMGFIFRASIVLFRNCLFRKRRAAPPHENSNNPLAVKPESENDADR